MNRILSINYFLQFFIFFSNLLLSQNNIRLNSHSSNDEVDFIQQNNIVKKSHLLSGFNLSFHTNYILNSGHPNIDNNAELYAARPSTRLISARLEYATSWLSLSLEPYTILQNGIFNNDPGPGTYGVTNNHNANNYLGQTKMGFRQSRLVLHYKGIGIGYGNMSHWWGPGFHSALALSSNTPSQETYSLGTFKDIRVGQFAFGSQIIVMPYKSTDSSQLYFSGLKAHVSHHSRSAIITLGLHRTYLSGDFGNLSSTTVSADSWSLIDAARLVIEPLFGQSKKDLAYTIPGTPGFDAWDEILTGFVKVSFPESHLQVYADIASDDNRGNIMDLKAHWDHTLGYLVGFRKYYLFRNQNVLISSEYLSTKTSNTFNPKFWRGSPNAIGYYGEGIYDYYSYQGRRMGAHSGSSSDDLIFMLGFSNDITTTFMSFNKERHGIKNMTYPELKTEYVLSYHRNITSHHTAFITIEYEHIKNFGFVQNNVSVSKLIWLGYSFSIN
jgi:hypothetical protein